MKELFLKETRSIFTFKEGEIIIRGENAKIKRSLFNHNLGVEMLVTSYESASYRTQAVKFLEIQNNIIYVDQGAAYNSNRISLLPIEDYENGWLKFKTPKGMKIEDFYKED